MGKELNKGEILERIKNEEAEEAIRAAKSPQDRLAELQLAELEEKLTAKKVEDENLRKLRLINALEAKRKEEERVMTQSLCNHRKPNNNPAVVAYRAQDYVEQFICQNCFKEWYGDQVPTGLRPLREHIGGSI